MLFLDDNWRGQMNMKMKYLLGIFMIFLLAMAVNADYLWNPSDYNAEASLSEAIKKLASPDAVSALIAWR